VKGKGALKPGDTEEEPAGPGPGREDQEGEFPNTRHHAKAAQDKNIPLVPDPKSEVMQLPHNAITYSTGKRSFEYAADEWVEYAHDAFVMAKFPDAFQDKNEFVTEFLLGEHQLLDDWSQVQNCTAAEQKNGDYQGLYSQFWAFKGDEWADKATGDEEQDKEQFKEYLDELISKADEEDEETTPPVVLGLHKDDTTGKETTWLITGNSRALIYAFLGKPASTRIVPLKGRMLPDPTENELNGSLYPAEQSSEDADDKEQNVRAAVQQVIQARGAPQDAPAAAASAAPPQPPAEQGPPQEAIWTALKGIFEGVIGPPKRKYPSGHIKRLFRKAYRELGYPVGTVRNWDRGKMVKTAKGWELVPHGSASTKPASAPVPAAKHDNPTSPASAGQPPEDGHWIDHLPGHPKQTIDKHYEGWKKPKSYRQKLHNSILKHYFDKVPAPSAEELKTHRPVAIMLMGGPASGKSTIGGAYPDTQFVHLDADALKHHIPEYKLALKWRARDAAEMSHEESIHLMQQLREKTIAAKKNLVMDGTGRHLGSYLSMISKLKSSGYHVKVVMADLDPETAQKRAKVRKATDGRWVPPTVFDAAYRDVPRNFQAIAAAGDDFELWNTRPNGAPELKWEKTAGKEHVHDANFVQQFKQQHSTERQSSHKTNQRALNFLKRDFSLD
jgi:predicted kinase